DLAATVLTIKTDAYAEDKQDLMWDIATILNGELRALAAAGCKVIQIEEPAIHSSAAFGAPAEVLDFLVELFNHTVEGLDDVELVLSSDCGFGRQGVPRPIAVYKAAALAQGANIVRGELGAPQTGVRAADPELQIDVPALQPEAVGA